MDPNMAWLAGMIDADGSVVLAWVGAQKTPHLRVHVYNSEPLVIDKVRSIVEGVGLTCGVSLVDARSSGARASYALTLSTLASLALHPHVRPFMVEPHKIARWDAAATFFDGRYASGRQRVHWTDIDKKEWEALRVRLCPQMAG